jgi:uncharacterized protein
VDLTIQNIKEQGLLLFECVSGSRAYGTNVATSDTDLKGVFVLPQTQFYGLGYVEQVSSPKHDEVYFELGRFAQLLLKNNPGVLEMLATPPDCVRFCHPLFEPFLQHSFLSKLCKDSFAGFAFAQIKKARGLNKKINVPEPPVRKTPLDFCYVPEGQGAVPVTEWLARRHRKPENCGLVGLSNMPGLYALFYDDSGGNLGFSGIVRSENANEVALSSVPKGMERATLMSFNKDAYSVHCRNYREYKEWEEHRNEARYQNTLEHGKNYDAKNMMHTIRLLDMALEILERGELRVRRPNRDYLLDVRNGVFSYEELMDEATQRLDRVQVLYETTTLPDTPDKNLIERLLVETRRAFYNLLHHEA